jgi:hypothetical protein
MRIAVVGTTRAGKTVYLAALLRAGFTRRHARPIKVRAAPGDDASQRLERLASGLLCGDALPATTGPTSYELFADLPGSRLFDIGRETVQLQLVDVPGGDCLPPPGQAVQPAVVQAVAAADALLLVIPADAMWRPDDLEARVLHLARAASLAGAPGRRGTRFARIAVVVSMAELLVPADAGALAALEALDPTAVVTRLCGAGFVAAVRRLVPRGGDWYALVSAFGFDQATGAPAAELVNGEWRLRTDGERFRDDWWPYRVFEPVEFLARGTCWREAV